MKRSRVKTFKENSQLKKLCLYNSVAILYLAVCNLELTGSSGERATCALFSNKIAKRNTAMKCATCLVPLCTSHIPGDTKKYCFNLWHSEYNLKKCHKIANAKHVQNQARNLNSPTAITTRAASQKLGENCRISIFMSRFSKNNSTP